MRRLRLALIGLLLGAAAAQAQDPGAEILLESQNLETGEMVGGQLVVRNTGQPDVPAMKAPPGLELEVTSAMPSTSTRMSIINNRRSQQTTYTYAFRVTAIKAGAYTLGPFDITADGRTYRTNELKVVVKPPSAARRADGDALVFARITVEPTTLYVTESFTATLQIGIRKVERRGRLVDMDMLRGVLDLGSSELSIFAGGTARRSETTLNDSTAQPHRYELFTVGQTIRAEQVGEIRVGPVFLKANYPTELRQNVFGSFEAVRTTRETARADAIVVTVKGPPDEGRPKHFSGAIGRFGFKVSAAPTRVTQGQPITLSIIVIGSPLEGVPAPSLADYPELASRFDFVSDDAPGEIENNTKTFRKALFPRQVGEQTIPPMAFSYFDLDRKSYVTISSDAITIQVDPRADDGGSRFGSGETESDNHAGLTLLTGGLSPNYADPSGLLVGQSLPSTGVFALVGAAPPALFAAAALISRRRHRLERDPGYARRRRAAASARAVLAQARRESDPARRAQVAARAVTGYVADRLDLPSESLTLTEAAESLDRLRLPPDLAAAVVEFLRFGETVRYAPVDASDPRLADASRIESWITQMEEVR